MERRREGTGGRAESGGGERVGNTLRRERGWRGEWGKRGIGKSYGLRAGGWEKRRKGGGGEHGWGRVESEVRGNNWV